MSRMTMKNGVAFAAYAFVGAVALIIAKPSTSHAAPAAFGTAGLRTVVSSQIDNAYYRGGRGHYRRGYYGRGVYGRGYYGRGFYGRGYYAYPAWGYPYPYYSYPYPYPYPYSGWGW